jgi:excisionase family DNA binding protein
VKAERLAETLTPVEIAERYGFDKQTVRAWIAKGELRAVNLGGTGKGAKYRVHPDDLDDFLARRVTGRQEAS